MTKCSAYPIPLAIALMAALAAPPIAFADRAAIEQALTEMQAAAAATDQDAYLSHVSRADPIFYKEQSNWAKDLKRKPPEKVTFSIAKPRGGKDDADPEFGDIRSRFEMVTAWTMPSDRGDPLAREISFPVIFVLEDGKWMYAGEDWKIMQSDDGPARDARFQGIDPDSARESHAPRHRGARVRFFPGYETVAERIVNVLPIVRDHVDEGFGIDIPRVQEVKIYPSMRHLQESIYLSYVDGLAGWNEPGEAIKIITRPTTSARALRSLLAHEYGHVATFELGPKANDMPWWALEGVAELSAERFKGNGKGTDAETGVLSWYRDNNLAAWEDLADFHKVQDSPKRELQTQVYKQGQHMLMFISDTFGKEGRNAWLREMSHGKTIDEATLAALKMPFAELDAKWRKAVAALAEKAAADRAARDEKKKSEDSKDPAPAEKPQG